jgi:hypothetical protein
LAFLGGSTTFCAEVSSNEASWPHLVWKAVQDKWPNVRFDYVNAAFVGYTVHESLRNLQHRVAPPQPDVIVMYEGINDLSKDTRELAKEKGLFSEKTVESASFLSRWSLADYLIETKVKMIARQHQGGQNAGRLAFDPQRLSTGFHKRLRALVESAKGGPGHVGRDFLAVGSARPASRGAVETELLGDTNSYERDERSVRIDVLERLAVCKGFGLLRSWLLLGQKEMVALAHRNHHASGRQPRGIRSNLRLSAVYLHHLLKADDNPARTPVVNPCRAN